MTLGLLVKCFVLLPAVVLLACWIDKKCDEEREENDRRKKR